MLFDSNPYREVATKMARFLEDVLDTLSTMYITEEVPGYIRSDNGSEFTTKIAREWIG